MDEKERAKLENRILRLERTVQELLLAHIEDKLGETKIELKNLLLNDDLEKAHGSQPGVV